MWHKFALYLRSGRQPVGKWTVRRFSTPKEYLKGENLLLMAIQKKYFSREIEELLSKGVMSPISHADLRQKNSKLTNICPFLDENFLIRAGTRLQNSTLSFDAKYPIVLPSESHHVKSLIRHNHALLGHALIEHVYHYLRRKFYIIGGKAAVANVIRICLECQKANKLPSDQKMAVLPEDRSRIIRPFKSCGIDCLGPWPVKFGRRSSCKRWVLLITCLSTRAVMLFPLIDMSTQSFLSAMTKFMSLYPGLETIYCDCGSNFKGGESLTRELIDEFNTELVEGELAKKSVTFKFNSPYSPHMGGLFERLVRSVKKTLSHILDKTHVHYDVLDTALYKCSQILNSRPLAPCGTDLSEIRTLCPQDFLTPYMVNPHITLDPPITPCSEDLRGAWFEVRRIADEFKTRWETEYLVTLQNRPKWLKVKDTFYVGQIILLSDPVVPRTQWNIGRILEILPSSDGIPRRYKVKMIDGRILERHHNRLIPLELEEKDVKKE